MWHLFALYFPTSLPICPPTPKFSSPKAQGDVLWLVQQVSAITVLSLHSSNASTVHLYAFTLTLQSSPAASKRSPNTPAVFYQRSSCCFHFLQPYYDRTGSHRIYHLLWTLKGVVGVGWGGGRFTHATK